MCVYLGKYADVPTYWQGINCAQECENVQGREPLAHTLPTSGILISTVFPIWGVGR